MKNNIIKLVTIIGFIIIIIGVLIFFNKNKKIEIPDNANLKIELDFQSAPSWIMTYYFYDDSIISTSYSAGLLSTGPVINTTTTKYYYNEKIDLTELMKFLEGFSKDTDGSGAITVTLDNGESYFIAEKSFEEENGLIAVNSEFQMEIFEEIIKITEKAYKEESYEERN